MKAVMMCAAAAALLAGFEATAATAHLASQASDGFRRTCTYAFNGRTESVSIAASETCPMEREVDLVTISNTPDKKKRSRRANDPKNEFVGERTQGSTKSCAYRTTNGNTVYRVVRSDGLCPTRI